MRKLRIRGYKSVCAQSAEHEISNVHKNQNAEKTIKIFLASKLPDVVYILLINFTMPTIVGIFIFRNRLNFMLS